MWHGGSFEGNGLMNIDFARFALAAAALLAAVPAQAAAEPRGEPFAVRVPTAGLDLATAQGRRALLERMRIAARQTCAPLPPPAAYEPSSLRACLRAFDAASRTALSGTAVGGPIE